MECIDTEEMESDLLSYGLDYLGYAAIFSGLAGIIILFLPVCYVLYRSIGDLLKNASNASGTMALATNVDIAGGGPSHGDSAAVEAPRPAMDTGAGPTDADPPPAMGDDAHTRGGGGYVAGVASHTTSSMFVCDDDDEYRGASKVKAWASIAPVIFLLALLFPLAQAIMALHYAFAGRDHECTLYGILSRLQEAQAAELHEAERRDHNQSFSIEQSALAYSLEAEIDDRYDLIMYSQYVLPACICTSILSGALIYHRSWGTAAYYLTVVCFFGGYGYAIAVGLCRCWEGRDMGPAFWCAILLFLIGSVLPDILFCMRRPAKFKFKFEKPDAFSKIMDWVTGESMVTLKATVDFIISSRELIKMPSTNVKGLKACPAAYAAYVNRQQKLKPGDSWSYDDVLQVTCPKTVEKDACDPSDVSIVVRLDAMYSHMVCTTCSCLSEDMSDYVNGERLSTTPITMAFLAFTFVPIVFLIIVKWKSHILVKRTHQSGRKLVLESEAWWKCSWLTYR